MVENRDLCLMLQSKNLGGGSYGLFDSEFVETSEYSGPGHFCPSENEMTVK